LITVAAIIVICFSFTQTIRLGKLDHPDEELEP